MDAIRRIRPQGYGSERLCWWRDGYSAQNLSQISQTHLRFYRILHIIRQRKRIVKKEKETLRKGPDQRDAVKADEQLDIAINSHCKNESMHKREFKV